MNRAAFRISLSVALAVCSGAAAARAQQPGKPAPTPSPPVVAAVVNGEPIYVGELHGKYSEIAQRKRISPQLRTKAMAELLTQLVRRRLVIQALERDKNLFKPEEVDRQQARVAAQLRKEYGLTLEKYAEMSGVTVESMRKELVWQVAWNRYLERHLVDALEGYFNRHKKDLDGTEVRASHILLRPQRYNESNAEVVARANKIRDEIESGKITFEDAAAKYSAGPSRDQGGDLGFIARYGMMVPDFTKAAFELDEGKISEPVTTAFGTHLIRVTGIKPGNRQWTEVIPQIKTLASADLFDQVADTEMQSAKIEYTGATPYIDPDTQKLVLPKPAEQAATK